MAKHTGWDEEAEVIIVGYGGAGAVAAITAHDAGAKVLILEKQPCDSNDQTRHTPNSRMCGGAWFYPTDLEKSILYMEGMVKVASETLNAERKELISAFARHLMEDTPWMEEIGVRTEARHDDKGLFALHGISSLSDFPELPGSNSIALRFAETTDKFRDGAALFKSLSEAIQKRNIQTMWDTRATQLVTSGDEVRGVVVIRGNQKVRIRASRAVILTCGGFEFNDSMKENYLRVSPVHFYGNPANTGDGISMAMEIGADFWHMNDASARVTMKFPDFPIAFSTQRHGTSVFVDKRGKRFTNERFRLHTFGYELTAYDGYALCYPKVPCYWIFDEKRRALAPLASHLGACNPPGGILGDIFYVWSADNQKEIERGWIMKANTVEELSGKILADPDNGGLMNASDLRSTIKQYNAYCKKGNDPDFRKPVEWLQPLEDGPYYAVKLWPGGPNTQGGPKRNLKGQVLRINQNAIPRLYSAGELGSVWGMLYQGGGNVAECITFGRIAGMNAAAERVWK